MAKHGGIDSPGGEVRSHQLRSPARGSQQSKGGPRLGCWGEKVATKVNTVYKLNIKLIQCNDFLSFRFCLLLPWKALKIFFSEGRHYCSDSSYSYWTSRRATRRSKAINSNQTWLSTWSLTFRAPLALYSKGHQETFNNSTNNKALDNPYY